MVEPLVSVSRSSCENFWEPEEMICVDKSIPKCPEDMLLFMTKDLLPFCLDRHETTYQDWNDNVKMLGVRPYVLTEKSSGKILVQVGSPGELNSEGLALIKTGIAQYSDLELSGGPGFLPPLPGVSGIFNGSNQPVVGAFWTHAEAYCRSVGKRLPVEVEWEAAAKRSKFVYEGLTELTPEIRRDMDSLSARLGMDWYSEEVTLSPDVKFINVWLKDRQLGKDVPDSTWESCSRGRNVYGMCDLDSNVREWTYKKEHYLEAYFSRSSDDITGDSAKTKEGAYILCGSSWDQNSIGDASAQSMRREIGSGISLSIMGIRCAKTPEFDE